MKKNNTKHELDIELLRKYFQKRCDQGERELIKSWFSDIGYEGRLRSLLGEHWEEIALESQDYDFDTDRLLDLLHHKIHLDSYKKSRSVPFYRKAYRQLSKIAAVLLLPLMVISTLYFVTDSRFFAKGEKSVYAEICSPLAARTRFELPDGSTGWLNSGSTLKFPVKFSGSQRKVELSGEGFFNVVKDSKKPFIVNASGFDIVALGTSFNVMAYPDDEIFNITQESGKVSVERTEKNGEPKKLTELKPGQQFNFSPKTGIAGVKKVVPAKYTSWKEGKLVFRNDSMHEVARRISRWYNVEINIKGDELKNYTFRATFENESFTEVLKLLKASSPIDYVEHKREMLSDGTYKKKTVTLFIKPGQR